MTERRMLERRAVQLAEELLGAVEQGLREAPQAFRGAIDRPETRATLERLSRGRLAIGEQGARSSIWFGSMFDP